MSLNYFLAILSLLCLTACQRDLSYDYLMRHPSALRQAIDACEAQPASPHCDDVSRASEDFQALINERIDDPEAFGQKIIRQQQLIVQAKQAGQDTTEAKQMLASFYAAIVATSQRELSGD